MLIRKISFFRNGGLAVSRVTPVHEQSELSSRGRERERKNDRSQLFTHLVEKRKNRHPSSSSNEQETSFPPTIFRNHIFDHIRLEKF